MTSGHKSYVSNTRELDCFDKDAVIMGLNIAAIHLLFYILQFERKKIKIQQFHLRCEILSEVVVKLE